MTLPIQSAQFWATSNSPKETYCHLPCMVVVAILPLGATVPGSTSGPTLSVATFPHGRVDLSLTVKAGPELSRYFCNVWLLLCFDCFFLGGVSIFQEVNNKQLLRFWLSYSPQATFQNDIGTHAVGPQFRIACSNTSRPCVIAAGKRLPRRQMCKIV